MVTIPTIDQISGTTVMNKLRSLINAFINYANDMNEEITVISTQSSSAYEIATQTAATVQDNFYTKSEINTLLSRKAYEFDCMDPLFIIQYSAYMNRIGIHFDGETIINGISGLAVNIDDNTLYYDSVSGKVKALSYSAGVGTSMNLAREISINVGNGLYVDTNNAVMSKIDGDTIKFDSNGVMHIPIDNNTIYYDSTNGVIKANNVIENATLVTTTDWQTGIVEYDSTNTYITFLKDVFMVSAPNTTPSSFVLFFPKGLKVHKSSVFVLTVNLSTTANWTLFIIKVKLDGTFNTGTTVNLVNTSLAYNNGTITPSSTTTSTAIKNISASIGNGYNLYVR